MKKFYKQILYAEIILLFMCCLFDYKYFINIFIIANIIFMPPAIIIILTNFHLIYRYYDEQLYKYNAYFKNKNISDIHKYICNNFIELISNNSYCWSESIKYSDANAINWCDIIKHAYDDLSVIPGENKEEFIICLVAKYRDDLSSNKKFINDALNRYQQPLCQLIDVVYTNAMINCSSIKITDQQYFLYKAILHLLPEAQLFYYFHFQYFKRHFLIKYIIFEIIFIFAIAYFPILEIIAVIIMVVSFLKMTFS